MKSIALAFGLAEDAGEAEVLAATVKLKGLSEELCSATGKATPTEALGAVRGLVQTKAAYDKLLEQQAAQQLAAREAAVEAIWAEAVSAGKRTPAQVEAARASRKAGNRRGSGGSKVSVAIFAKSSRAEGAAIRCGQARV